MQLRICTPGWLPILLINTVSVALMASCSLLSLLLDEPNVEVRFIQRGYALTRLQSDVRLATATGELTPEEVYFRSSHIEFWSIEGEDHIDVLQSAYYSHGLEGLQDSVNANLLDSERTFVFRPDEDVDFSAESSPIFDARRYNLARIDIGAGQVMFKHSGGEIPSGLNANSIFFVDDEYLSTPIVVTRPEAREIEAGAATSGSSVVDRIILNSNYADSDEHGMIDVDGALFLPFNSIDLTDLNEVDSVVVDIYWDLQGILIEDESGAFSFADRVGGTPFDLEIVVRVL